MNIGFIEAHTHGYYDCVVFHDVDLYPENDYNSYGCPGNPTHLSAAIDKHDYKSVQKITKHFAVELFVSIFGHLKLELRFILQKVSLFDFEMT